MAARNQAGREITLQSDPVEYTAALRAENQRLREALEAIAAGRPKDWLKAHGLATVGGFSDRITDVAIAALNPRE